MKNLVRSTTAKNDLNGEYIEITVGDHIVTIDSLFYPHLASQIQVFNAGPAYYAILDRKHQQKYLHRWVMEQYGFDIEGKIIDHADRNPLNCRIHNLRIATRSQNRQNSRGWSKTCRYKGICKRVLSTCIRYDAHINFNKKRISLGRYEYDFEAAEAYNIAAHELFGEFAVTNRTQCILSTEKTDRIKHKISEFVH